MVQVPQRRPASKSVETTNGSAREEEPAREEHHGAVARSLWPFCQLCVGLAWFEMGVCCRGICDCVMGCDWALVSLLRYLAISDQYRHNDRHLSHGLSDPEHAEPRCASHQPQAGRTDPCDRQGAQSHDQY